MATGRFLFIHVIAAAVLSASFEVAAQPPDAPIDCPTSAVVNDAVCANKELTEGAFEVEKKYLSAVVAGDYSKVLIAKTSWLGQYIQCGHLIGRKQEMMSCIKSSFSEFGSRLQEIAPLLEQERSALLDAALVRMETAVAAARKRRIMCIQAKAAVYDDGVSSARDIAVVVAKECRPNSYELARTMAAQIEISRPLFSRDVPSAEAILSVSQDLSNPDDFISIILERRATNRAPAKSSAKTKPKTLGM